MLPKQGRERSRDLGVLLQIQQQQRDVRKQCLSCCRGLSIRYNPRQATVAKLLKFLGTLGSAVGLIAAGDAGTPRNVVIFVADGLRPGAVNATDAPTFLHVRTDGVNFVNSHSMVPTVTMPNAAAIATGHYPGDSGQFGNNVFLGYPVFNTGNFGRRAGTMAPNVETDEVLADTNEHFGGNYVGHASLISLARLQGYNTAVVGKVGPTAMQALSELRPAQGSFTIPGTIILDSATGTATGIPLSPDTSQILAAAGLGAAPPARNQPAGTNTTPGTLAANVAHQQWFADAITKAIVPKFVASGKPFVIVFWSGDPDQTQHSQGDSLNRLTPGVNGPTSRAAVRNADGNLKQILDYVNGNSDLRSSTDIFVTSDHGFATGSRHEVDAEAHFTKSYSATFTYRNAMGRQEVNDGFLPGGYFAIDLAHALGLPLFDSDTQISDGHGGFLYAPVDPTVMQQTATVRQRPLGSALIGGSGRVSHSTDAKIVIAGNSMYVPDRDRDMVRKVVAILAQQDYVGGLFVHDSFGKVPGALPLSAIGFIGSAVLPQPAIVIMPRGFSLDPRDPLMTSVIVGGGGQQGQGTHGALIRSNTFNFMAAIGPDFKTHFVDPAPVGNADVQPTLAHILRMKVPQGGPLRGRVLVEALTGGPSTVRFTKRVDRSNASASGRATILEYQQIGRQRYFDQACFEQRACRESSPVVK